MGVLDSVKGLAHGIPGRAHFVPLTPAERTLTDRPASEDRPEPRRKGWVAAPANRG